jgi:hypothetical protein
MARLSLPWTAAPRFAYKNFNSSFYYINAQILLDIDYTPFQSDKRDEASESWTFSRCQ